MNSLAKTKNPSLVSRFSELALKTAVIIDKTIHAGETLARGTLLGKIVSSGKYRAYAQGTVHADQAFATDSAAFKLDPAGALVKHFRVGDVITTTSGSALGTIATFNSTTGVGTLSGNSASAAAAGVKVRVSTAVLALASSAGKLLEDEKEVTSNQDEVVAAYYSGHFVKANTSMTDEAITAMGGYDVESGETRLI